jgi:hypothetical protein
MFRVACEANQGIAAYFFQLLMIAQVPIMAFFTFKGVRQTPRQKLHVLALPASAAIAVLEPGFFFNLQAVKPQCWPTY